MIRHHSKIYTILIAYVSLSAPDALLDRPLSCDTHLLFRTSAYSAHTITLGASNHWAVFPGVSIVVCCTFSSWDFIVSSFSIHLRYTCSQTKVDGGVIKPDVAWRPLPLLRLGD